MAGPGVDNSAHEVGIVRSFIVPVRRKQFFQRLANPKTRGKILDQLAHFHDLDPRFARRIPRSEQTADKIYALLRDKGAPDRCYVNGDSELDGREVVLCEALEGIVDASFGNFVSCVPGKLGYFGGEEPSERYILERQIC